MWLMPIVTGNHGSKYDLDRTYHGNLVITATKYVANAYCLNESPYQIKQNDFILNLTPENRL